MKLILVIVTLLAGLNAQAAFIKATSTPQGDSANYWTETQANLNIQGLTVQCTLALYLSQSAYAAHDVQFKTKVLPPMKIQSSDLQNSAISICEKYIQTNYVSGSPKDTFLVGATQQ